LMHRSHNRTIIRGVFGTLTTPILNGS
jgi:hypothetical protein